MERIPVEILEELKELIEGEIIFRSRKEEESSLQLLDSRGTIH